MRHYWKYSYEPWVQPVLTSATSYGLLKSTDVGDYYKMYDNNINTDIATTHRPTLVTWILPDNEKIKISAIDFYNRYTGGTETTRTLQLFADEAKTKPLTDIITVNGGSRALTHIDIPVENQQFSNEFAVNLITSNGSNVGCAKIDITAQKQTVIEGTPDDYDFYTDDDVITGVKKIVRHYWKYQYIAWTQPVLTSNTSSYFFQFSDPVLSNGTISNPENPEWGNASVQYFTDFWRAFDNASGYFGLNAIASRYAAVVDIEFYNPLKISQIYIDGHTIGSVAAGLQGSLIYDMSSGTPVLLSQSTEYQYNTHNLDNAVCSKIRMCFKTNSDGGGYRTRIQTITITAQERTVVAGTSSDYDFYTDDEVAFLPTKIVRSYWYRKNILDAYAVGSPIITDGVVSNITSANYVQMPTPFVIQGNNTWDAIFKVKRTADQYSAVIGTDRYAYNSTRLAIDATGKMVMYWGYYEYDYAAFTGNFQIPLNQWYYVRYTYDATTATLLYSTDGINWITDATKPLTGYPGSTQGSGNNMARIGWTDQQYGWGNFPFAGEIDLKGCSIIFNGDRINNIEYSIPATEDDYDYYTDETVYYGINQQLDKIET